MAIVFPQRARRDDPNGHMVVQNNLDFLRDEIDTVVGKIKTGTATVTNGNTTVTVTHGIGVSSASVAVSPINNPGGNWWISGKTPTTFIINLATPAPIAGVAFDWTVRGA